MATQIYPSSPVHPAVHNVTLTQSARLTLQGRAVPTQQVQYYVGTHGPFTDSYDLDHFTPDEAQQGILSRVHAVQQLDPGVPGPPVDRHEPPEETPSPGVPPRVAPPIYHLRGTPPPVRRMPAPAPPGFVRSS